MQKKTQTDSFLTIGRISANGRCQLDKETTESLSLFCYDLIFSSKIKERFEMGILALPKDSSRSFGSFHPAQENNWDMTPEDHPRISSFEANIASHTQWIDGIVTINQERMSSKLSADFDNLALKVRSFSIYIPLGGVKLKKLMRDPVIQGMCVFACSISIPEQVQSQITIQNSLQNAGLNIEHSSAWKRVKTNTHESYTKLKLSPECWMLGTDLIRLSQLNHPIQLNLNESHNNIQQTKQMGAYHFVKQRLETVLLPRIYEGSEEDVPGRYEEFRTNSKRIYDKLVPHFRFLDQKNRSKFGFRALWRTIDSALSKKRTLTLPDEEVQQWVKRTLQQTLSVELPQNGRTAEQSIPIMLQIAERDFQLHSKNLTIIQVLLQTLRQMQQVTHNSKIEELQTLHSQEIKQLQKSLQSRESLDKYDKIQRQFEKVCCDHQQPHKQIQNTSPKPEVEHDELKFIVRGQKCEGNSDQQNLKVLNKKLSERKLSNQLPFSLSNIKSASKLAKYYYSHSEKSDLTQKNCVSQNRTQGKRTQNKQNLTQLRQMNQERSIRILKGRNLQPKKEQNRLQFRQNLQQKQPKQDKAKGQKIENSLRCYNKSLVKEFPNLENKVTQNITHKGLNQKKKKWQ